jgi:hypothetical protein
MLEPAPSGTPTPPADDLAASAFVRGGGWVVLPDLFAAHTFAALSDEARRLESQAVRSVWTGSEREEWRGGDPARAYAAAPGGPVQYSVFASPDMARVLTQVCGVAVVLSGAGTYSYYHQPGDFLALHRDVLQCDVAVLTCVMDTGGGAPGRGALRLYPAFAREPLSVVRSSPDPRPTDIVLGPGQTAVLFGGLVPHEVRPMAGGQRRTMSVMCFQARPGSAPGGHASDAAAF